ncbi:YqaJ domain-containing protein [Aphis craccivora]|uniref:YqaJ domain-containing protein n=1 Tax=Aphis craccivora TaxID=307492 RepID=A0A6G0VLA2_APHCR|nr:YqaJ domain-containing protein [Aphis craccivora]
MKLTIWLSVMKVPLVLIALVHLLLLVFGLPYILWCVSCLHRIVAFWVEPGVLVAFVANSDSDLIIYKVKKNIFPHGPDEDYGAVEHPAAIVDMSIEECEIKKNESITNQ